MMIQRQHKVTLMQERTKPAGLKKIAGSQHRLPPETKPVRMLECPPELGPMARQEWDRIVSELTSKGVLSSFDRGPLAVYCNAYAQYFEAMEEVQKYGAMIKSPNGYPVQSPYLAVANRHADTMIRIASEFGFTPASRSRIFSFKLKNSLLLDGVDEPGDDGSPGW
jgi:P27 family predicted phage terminase small subunit